MRYDFPCDITIDEVRVAIANHNERLQTQVFVEADRGEFVVFNYILSFNGSFPFPNTGDAALDREYAILRECRGLTFHKDGRILARKFHKFFNVNEKPETQINVVDWSEPHRVLEKMDGSMIAPIWLGDPNNIDAKGIRWTTKMGITDIAKPVEDWVALRDHYAQFARECIWNGWTPLFEWCSRHQRIVIDYPQDRLVLLAIRDNRTGRYLPYEKLRELAIARKIDFVRALPGGLHSIEEFMDEVRDVEGMEGYIIVFDDGRKYKVKGAWYCQIHRTKEFLTHEKDVLALIVNDLIDDAKAFMTDEDRARVDGFHTAYEARLSQSIAELAALYNSVVEEIGTDKKTFALHVKNNFNADQSYLLLNMIKGYSAADTVRNAVKRYIHPTAATQPRVDEARKRFFEGVYWKDYYFENIEE